MQNFPILFAGIICLLTAILHTFGGQLTLVDPLLDSGLPQQIKTEWLGAWHMITFMLFYLSFLLVKNGFVMRIADRSLIQTIGWMNALFAISFILVSIWRQQHAPQYMLFLPIAVLVFWGNRRFKQVN